jgi:hypothetical protein
MPFAIHNIMCTNVSKVSSYEQAGWPKTLHKSYGDIILGLRMIQGVCDAFFKIVFDSCLVQAFD